MNENIKQPMTQEKNLALERAEAVKSHNDILKDYNDMPENDKEWNYDKNEINNPEASNKKRAMSSLRESVGNIDKYRNIAKPEKNEEYQVGDISNIEKLAEEKKKVDIEIENTKKSIEDSVRELNELRAKLGMPDTDDIPSLTQKKEKLTSLFSIQKELENRINFETKKIQVQEDETQGSSKMENRYINEGVQEISRNLKMISRLLDERNSSKFSHVFQDENMIRTLASKNFDSLTIEEIKGYTIKIREATSVVSQLGNRWSTNDIPDSMYRLGKSFSLLSESIKNISSKIIDENERRNFSKTISDCVQYLDQIYNVFIKQAHNIEEYQKVRM